jgi:hypothetical protein
MKFFAELGRELDRRWAAGNFDERLFPDLAVAMLGERSPVDHVSADEITDWILGTDVQVTQKPSDFGDPPIMVYQDSRIIIQALMWVDGTTAIHQHAFSGAFQVFAGSSIHSQWRFEETARINSSFLFGALQRTSLEALSRGDVRPIHGGANFIHSLFHLDRPSISVVVRTKHEHQYDPQYMYLPPCVAEDPFASEPLAETRIRCLASMAQCDPGYDRALERFIDRHDFKSVFAAIRQDYRSRKSDDRLAGLVDRMRERHGELVDLLAPVLAEDLRRHNITGWRADITNEEHRYLLALLLNLENQGDILRMVSTRFPGDARQTVMRWIRELSTNRPDGTFELFDLKIEPDGRDVGFTFEAMAHTVFEAALHNASPEQLMATARERFGARAVDAEAESVDALHRAIKDSSAFRPLFR